MATYYVTAYIYASAFLYKIQRSQRPNEDLQEYDKENVKLNLGLLKLFWSQIFYLNARLEINFLFCLAWKTQGIIEAKDSAPVTETKSNM